MDDYEIHWDNAFSIRFWWNTFFASALLGFGIPGLVAWFFPFEFEDIPEPVLWAFFIPALLLVGFTFLTTPTHCSSCGKRIQMGFDVCSRCGRTQ